MGSTMASSSSLKQPPQGSTTPIRSQQQAQQNNNNYAAPHTPIASVKRPRSSLEPKRPPSSNKNPTSPPLSRNSGTPAAAAMSPMHPPRPAVEEPHQGGEEESSSWVGRQVDALFSPVLNFLGSGNDEEEVHAVTDVDDTTNMMVEKEESNLSTEHEETTTETSLQVKESSSSDAAFDEQNVGELHHDMGDLEETTPSSSYDDEEEFNPYLFIKSLPRYDLVKGEPRTCLAPKQTQHDDKITLVLDLDETLVHCTVDPIADADLVFPVFFHGMEYQVHVRLRPYLYEFLERIHDQYEVVVFTASQKVYADELLNRIDPGMSCLVVVVV